MSFRATVVLAAATACSHSEPSLTVVMSPVPISVGSSTEAQLIVSDGSSFVLHHMKNATCDDGACEVKTVRADSDPTISGAPTLVLVRPLRRGDLTLRITVVGEDGSEVEGTHAFTSADTEEVSVVRSGVQLKEADAVLVGSSLTYSYDAFGPSRSPIIFSSEGMSLTWEGLEPTFTSADLNVPGGTMGYPKFVARQPGVGIVTVRVGAATGVHQARIVRPEDVVSLTLHRRLIGNEAQNGETYEPAAFDGATWEDKYGGGIEIVPVSQLADGTLAVGGSDHCTVSPEAGVDFGGLDGLSFHASMQRQGTSATVTVTCIIGAGRAETTVRLKGHGT